MEDKTLKTLEIKRARLKGVRPLTREERKVKAEIDMIRYFNKVIDRVPYLDNDGNVIRFIEDLKREINGKCCCNEIKEAKDEK